MSDIAKLRARLISVAKINQLTNEKLSNDEVDEYLRSALNEHAPSLGGDFSVLPDTHNELVILLAWISACYTRASLFAPETNTRGVQGAYAHEAATPVDKNLKLAKALRERYDLLREKLAGDGILDDLRTDVDDVTESSLYRREDRIGQLTPSIDPMVDGVVLSVHSVGDDDGPHVILHWTRSRSYDFHSYIVFRSLNPEIYEPWNFNEASTLKGISDSAEQIFSSTNRDDLGLKVIGVVPGETYYFLVVTMGRNRRYAYSNEVSAEVPEPELDPAP